MKSGKWLIIFLVIAMVAAYAVIGSDYLKQRRQNKALAAEISAAALSLSQIPPTTEDLTLKLEAAQAELQAVETAFAAETNYTYIVNAILKMAVDDGVTATPLNTQPWVNSMLSNRVYAVCRINLQVAGSFNQLQSFVNRLETGDMKTLIIETLSVEKTFEAGTSVNAIIQVAVYAMPLITP
jgi:Tfp pilus assembly protein PilO